MSIESKLFDPLVSVPLSQMVELVKAFEGNNALVLECKQLRQEVEGFRNILTEMQLLIGDLRREVSGR